MADAEGQLNRLSCSRCKDRKVRCNRVMPQCDRCKAQDLDCVYPTRQKRRVNRPPADRPILPNDAISTILERLQRVEEQCVTLPGSQPAESPRNELAPSPAYRPRVGLPSIRSLSASIASSPEGTTALDNHLKSLTHWSPSSRLPPPAIDATAVLKDSIDLVQRLRMRTLSSSFITDEVNIPPHLAKGWIQRYFSQKPTDMFLGLIDKKFIEMIPDMLSFPHVHLDSCVFVIYYGILWYGSAVASTECSADVEKWGRVTYLACLRALPGWQREATGAVADLIAALMAARVAAECFDYELAWNLYKQACDFAQGLGLHNLDGGDAMMGIHNPDISDDDRKAFWDLIQVDTFFRLIYNKPPTITGNPWKVNLPWLDPSSQPPPKTDMAMMFLVKSRLTLLLIRFFSMLEGNPADVSRMTPKTEEMCQEIKSLYDEWNLTKWAKNAEASEHDTWAVADVALNGYTCIIFMLRKMATLDTNSPQPITTDTDIPDSPIALDAARNIVDIAGWLLAKYPAPATVSSTFGAYRAYVPFAYLISHILRAPDVSMYYADIESLEKAGRYVDQIAQAETDLSPLARAMQSLNAEVRKKIGRL